MAMKLVFTDSEISHCGVAMEFAHGTEVEINGVGFVIRNCEKAIVERDPPSALASLGLPADTPPDYLKELLFALRAIPEAETQSKEQAIKVSRLWALVQNSANAATVLQALTAMGPVVINGLLGVF